MTPVFPRVAACRSQVVRLIRVVLQCVTVSLHRVAACFNVLQCVEVCRSVLQCVAVRCSALQCCAVRCSALQCVAACCRSFF